MNRVNEGGWLLVVDFMRLMIAIFIESVYSRRTHNP